MAVVTVHAELAHFDGVAEQGYVYEEILFRHLHTERPIFTYLEHCGMDIRFGCCIIHIYGNINADEGACKTNRTLSVCLMDLSSDEEVTSIKPGSLTW